jgi:DNA-3-methyladenine glycosylase I
VVALADQGVSLVELVWSFAGRPRTRAPRGWSDVPALTEQSTALAKELKKRGFRFVGPTTVYATMQAVGLVNDHLATCSIRSEVEKQQREARRKFKSRDSRGVQKSTE